MTLVQHWTRNAGRSKAVGVVRCEPCQAVVDALYDGTGTPRPGHVVRLSPSAARTRRCASCGATATDN